MTRRRTPGCYEPTFPLPSDVSQQCPSTTWSMCVVVSPSTYTAMTLQRTTGCTWLRRLTSRWNANVQFLRTSAAGMLVFASHVAATSKFLSVSLCRRAVACQCATVRSSSLVAEGKTVKLQTSSSVTTRQQASSQEWQTCRGQSPTMAVWLSTATVTNTTSYKQTHTHSCDSTH